MTTSTALAGVATLFVVWTPFLAWWTIPLGSSTASTSTARS